MATVKRLAIIKRLSLQDDYKRITFKSLTFTRFEPKKHNYIINKSNRGPQRYKSALLKIKNYEKLLK